MVPHAALFMATGAFAQNLPPSGVPPTVPTAPTTTSANHGNTNSPPLTFDPTIPQQRTPPTAPTVPESEKNILFVENADMASGEENTEPLTLAGNVRLRYNGYHAQCDRATYDRTLHLITLEGKVILDTGTQVVYGDLVQVNSRNNDFTAREARTIIPAGVIGPDIIEPVLLQGKIIRRRGEVYTAFNGQLTTCDFPNPHYKFGFRQADFIPNSRIILRDTTLYRYTKKVATVKYLLIPVHESNRPSIPPNVGRTEEEGYFIKFAINYMLNATLPGLLRIDIMQKKGIGLGFDQAYRLGANATGTLLLYSLRDRNRGVDNLNGRLNHQQYVGDTLTTIATDFQNNSYQSLSSNSKTATTTVTLSRNVDQHDTNISLTDTSSDYTTNRSNTTSYTLTETEHLGSVSTVIVRFNGSNSATDVLGLGASSSGRIEQDADIQVNSRLGIFDTTLKANRNLELKQTGDVAGSVPFTGTQRLPDLSLTTNTDRFSQSGLLSGFLRRIPASYTVGYGRYLDNVSTYTSGVAETHSAITDRVMFGFTPRDKTFELTPEGKLSLQTGGSFQQMVYREDAAQYILTGRSNLVEKLATKSSLGLTYNYLRPYGGAPAGFGLDQTGSANNLSANLTVETYRTRLALVSGYDILQARAQPEPGVLKTPWQNLALQLGLRASPVLQTRFTTTYDINHGKLLSVADRARIRGQNGFAFDTGVTFDPHLYRFPQVTEVLTLPLFSRDLTFSALTGYNGVTYHFNYKQFYLTQSFHDYEILFSYMEQPYGFTTQQGFNLSIRLKAFPSLRPPTTGQFGTPLDTGGGDTF
jgi:hypothetical protein